MNMYTVVRPEHLNHYGSLFGGQMLKWIDEFAYLAALREFPGTMLVTRAMDDVSFARGVKNGSMLRFHIGRQQKGRTSVTYHVTVLGLPPGTTEEELVFETSITFVAVNSNQEKVPLPEPVQDV